MQSSVAPRLKWVVNREEVTEFGLERAHPAVVTGCLPDTNISLATHTLALEFWVRKHHFRDGKVGKLKKPSFYFSQTKLLIMEVSTFTFFIIYFWPFLVC